MACATENGTYDCRYDSQLKNDSMFSVLRKWELCSLVYLVCTSNSDSYLFKQLDRTVIQRKRND